jgi:hypothetical protein
MNFGYSISHLWDILTRPNYIGAVLAIIFIQYRPVALNFFYTAINDGIMYTFFNLIINLADVIRGYYHMTRELIRSLGQNNVFSFVDENDGTNYAGHPMLQRESSHLYNNDNVNVPTRNNNHKRYSSCGPPPPLVVIRNSSIYTEHEMIAPKIGASPTIVATGPTSEILENEMEPLEPAFLNKEDYPPGWLVYHPVLGISSVKEADQYDEQHLFANIRKENTATPSETSS